VKYGYVEPRLIKPYIAVDARFAVVSQFLGAILEEKRKNRGRDCQFWWNWKTYKKKKKNYDSN
jgi:hypothetical protein